MGDHAARTHAPRPSQAALRGRRLRGARPRPRGGPRRPRRPKAPPLIPESVERRARWVLDTLGARGAGFGDDVPYEPRAWQELERGKRPRADSVAEAFFHLARVEERGAGSARDRHGRFPAAASCLDPLDPPLERLRRELGAPPPRWRGAAFAVALTHDVDVPRRWTRVGVRGGASRIKGALVRREARAAVSEARALATVPVHAVRGTDPWWTFERVTGEEHERGARSTFFLLAAHGHRADGPAPASYERLRPRLAATIRAGGAEVGLHGSYTGADDLDRLAAEKERLQAVAGPVRGQRYHYLRVVPDRNLAPLARLGFAYDTSLGFADAPGFRAGVAQPFRPWDWARDAPSELVEIPLAVMDVTLGERRYLGLSASEAERRLAPLLDAAAERGGGFAILWHNAWFDDRSFPGWGELYFRLVEGVHERGGLCLSAGELAEEAARWLR